MYFYYYDFMNFFKKGFRDVPSAPFFRGFRDTPFHFAILKKEKGLKFNTSIPKFYSFIILSIDCSLISLIILQLLSSFACSSSVNSRFNNSRTPLPLIIAGTPIKISS